MSWLDFIVAMTTAVLGTTGLASLAKLRERQKRPEVQPQQVADADDKVHRDDETKKLRERLDQFWEMHTELREEVQELRAAVDKLTAERDAAKAAVDAARADTEVVHNHVLELRERLDDDPPWPANYPPYLHAST